MKLSRVQYVLGAAVLVVCVCVVLGASWLLRYQALDDDSSFLLPPPAVADVTYCEMDGLPLKLDLYFPESQGTGPLPVAVYIHGGSFTGGDKRKGSSAVDIPAMVERGYVVAAVNYRLAPEHKFPAPLQDVKCAIRFLRAQSSTYRLDAGRIGVWGASAGGYLAAFVGLTGGRTEFDSGPYLEQSSRVAAVADLFGPTDLTAADLNLLQTVLLWRAFGTLDRNAPYLREASPVNYVTADAPPFLILHGEQDDAVPLSQSVTLRQHLQAAGVRVELVAVKNANHEFAPTGGPISPSRAELSKMLADFFDENLR